MGKVMAAVSRWQFFALQQKDNIKVANIDVFTEKSRKSYLKLFASSNIIVINVL